ncbi:S66 peptidase family protein [Bacillus kwashiorkori]|uniref:S66 peptidase family protein n=1 Tax=Bacillus kwashiorkori TaxID=1522318 RepID=UPI000780643D|nr:LD-carboxypeptidase [Bacillus kwashiorkori]
MAIKPTILREGDSIGLVTLGSPILNMDTYSTGVQMLRNQGFNIIFGRYVTSFGGIVSAPPRERAMDLMNMFLNANVKMILATRGGTGVQSIFPYLNFDVIRRNPKIVSGYSDITALLNALYQYSNIITFHSLMIADFRSDTPPYNFNQFFAATSTTAAPRVIENPPNMPLVSLVAGNVTGPIVGGNLTSIVNTLGTPYEIDTRGKILLIEEVSAPSNTIYRYLSQLSLAGKFNDCVGFIIGQCTNCLTSYGTTFDDLIRAFLVPLGKPMISNLATGHGYYKATIPIGATVTLNATNRTLTVMESTVSVG